MEEITDKQKRGQRDRQIDEPCILTDIDRHSCRHTAEETEVRTDTHMHIQKKNIPKKRE